MMSLLPGATARLAAMATALCDDGFVPIQHRLLAAEVLHRLRYEMPVSDDTLFRVGRLYTQRRVQLIQAVAAYSSPPC